MSKDIKKGNLNYDQSGRGYPDNPQIRKNWSCIWENNGKYYKLVGDNEHKEWEEIEKQKKVMNKVYVIWNPLYERVVCVHSSEELECLHCIEEREKVKDTAYSLEGKWFEIDSNNNLCYCGNPVDTSNPDCVSYNLCKEHAMDV